MDLGPRTSDLGGERIEPADFPRLSLREELALRACSAVWRTAIEIVELSGERLSLGTIYDLLGSLQRRSWVEREGRAYRASRQALRWLGALEEAAKAWRRGSMVSERPDSGKD